MKQAEAAATERVTTLMTPVEKASLETKAKRAGVSVGEYVRRSVDAFDPEEAMLLGQLAALAVELELSTRAASDALDRALSGYEEMRADFDKRRAA